MAGDVECARAVLGRTQDVAEGIAEDWRRAHALAAVAGALAAAREVERALGVVEEIADEGPKVQALVNVARALARAKVTPAEVLPLYQQVLRTAATLGRAATWQCIGALVPLFARIGRATLWETYERLERVEQLLRGAPPQPGMEAP